MSKFKQILTDVGYGSVRGLMLLFSKQPLKVHYSWSKVIAWLLRDVLKYRKSVIYTNLAWAFPEMQYKEIEDAADKYYDHMADLIVESIWFGGSSSNRIRKSRIAEFANMEVVSDLTKAGRSVIVLDSHCGNWELMGGYRSYMKDETPFPLNRDDFFVVYKELSNRVFDKVFYQNRISPEPGYQGLVESKKLLRLMLSRRDKPSVYLVNNDQYPGVNGIYIGSFLGQPTTAHAATATLAHKMGFAVVFQKMEVVSRGHYRISFEQITDDASKVDAKYIVSEYMRHLEAEILEQPYNWLWSHKRWKNKKAE